MTKRRPRRARYHRPLPVALATRRSRVVASLIDGIVLPTIVVNVLLVGAAAFGLSPYEHQPYAWMLALAVPFLGLNEVMGTALSGQTLGKRFMGIRVVSVERLEPPGWWRAAVRTVAMVPFGWAIRMGAPAGDSADHSAAGGSIAPSPMQPALHDLYAGTIVVDDDSWRAYRARRMVQRQDP